MRTALKNLEDCRMRFTGIFSRYGKKTNFKGYPEVTVLLLDIRFGDSGKPAADHIWLNHTKQFQALGSLRAGDTIEFLARVREYTKGYQGYREDVAMENPPRVDYKLSHPTKFRIVKHADGEIIPIPGNEAEKVTARATSSADPKSPTQIKRETVRSADQQTDLMRLI